MIRSSATVALVPSIRSGPWIYWSDLAASMAHAHRLGFDGIELFTPDAGTLDSRTLRDLLKDHQLSLAAVGTGAGKVLHGLTLTDVNPDIRARAIDYIIEMADFGAQYNAPVIIGSMQGNVAQGGSRGQALEWLAEGLEKVSSFSVSKGQVVLYEPLNRYESNLINTLADGVSFIESAGLQQVRLLADLFHMNIEERDIPDTIRECRDFIGHFHFADSNRRPVGLGHTSMGPIALAIKEIDYNGYVSAEAFPYPDSERAAAQTIDSFNSFFKN